MPLKYVLAAASALAVIGVAGSAFAAETIRIETRNFYGATVTVERGVRVFRPLPPIRRMIINPHGKTPLTLGFEDKQSVSHNYNYNYAPDLGRFFDDDDVAAVGALPFIFPGFKAERGNGNGGAFTPGVGPGR